MPTTNLTDDDWDFHQATIRYLYLTENRKLLGPGGVMQEMSMKNSFNATKAQYETHFNQWGFRKYKKKDVWEAAARKVTKRKRDNKESEVKIDGEIVPLKKLRKELSRYGYEASFPSGFQGPTPKTPEDLNLIVYTPPSHNFDAPSPAAATPASLSAWTLFEQDSPASVARSWLSPLVNCPSVHSPVPSTLADFRIFAPSDYPLQTQLFKNLPIFQLQVSIENLTESLAAISGASLNSETLLRTITQTKKGNSNHLLIDSLLPHSAFRDDILGNAVSIQQAGQMGTILFLYLISNSFPAESNRDKIYQLVKTQRNLSQGIFRTLKGHSADSLLENLFTLAVEAEDLPMVKNLIRAGANVDANKCKLNDCPIPLTPLQFACLKGNAPLAQELITAGSEIDAPESGWKCSAILLVIYGQEEFVRWAGGPEYAKPVDNEGLLDLVQKLLIGGASINGGETGMNDTTESIRQLRSKLEPGYRFYEIIAEQHSPLTLASKLEYKELVDFLILKGADVQFRMDGTSSALRQCLCRSLDWHEGKAYTLASRLDKWVDESKARSTIVHVARSLIQAGAELNDRILDGCDIDCCQHDRLECYSVLDLAILVGDPELVDDMLHADAKPTFHSLDLAIELKNFNIFSKLLAKGAPIPGCAITEGYSASLDGHDGYPRETNYSHLQSKRALVVAAVRLGATSELDILIKSLNGSSGLLDSCSELTPAIEACCTNGHFGTLQYLLAANIIPKPPPDTLFGLSVLLSIRHNRNDFLDLLLENRADVNAAQTKTLYRELPLHLAIKKGQLETVRKLIKAGAIVEDEPRCRNGHIGSLLCTCKCGGIAQNTFGNLLVAAIDANYGGVIEEVLRACVDINGLGKMNHHSFSMAEEYCTPLTMAIKKGNWMLVGRLRRRGAKVNHSGQSPGLNGVIYHHTSLWAATNQKDPALVQWLIEAGADINDRMAMETAAEDDDLLKLFIEKLGTTRPLNKKHNALHYALLKSIDKKSISKIVLILDSQLVDLSSTTGSQALNKVLNYSWGGVDHTLLNMLLTARANPNSFNSFGKTVINNAIEKRDAKSVQMILDAGAEIHPPFPPGVHHSPAQLAAKSSSPEILQMLLAFGCDPNIVAPPGIQSKTESFGSAIQYATESGSFEAVQILLMHDANPDAVTKTFPHTALQIASLNGSKSIAELLIASYANVNALPAKQFGATALQFAALGGYIGIAHLLIEQGADVNASPAEVDGRTALEGAAEYGRIDMVQFLVDAGADLSEVGDGQYERALSRAYNNGHYATRRLLMSYLS